MRPANVVDGNVERVIARLHAVETPLPAAKPELKTLAARLVDDHRPGDRAPGADGLLGATLCRPKAPLCERCPIARSCAAHASGAPETWPRRTAKADRPRRYGAAFLLTQGARIGLVRRPPKGLLGGMLGLPTSDWRGLPWTPAEARSAAPAKAAWRQVGEIEHVFTHFALTLQVWRAEVDGGGADLIWAEPADLAGLPSVFLKAARAGLTPLGC